MSPPDMLEVEPGVYSVLIDGASFEARIWESTIEISGHKFPLVDANPRQWKRTSGAAATDARATLTAAMPGKVIRVLVKVGEEVEAGHGILVLEAMKMQNELKSPRAGVVTAVNVKTNDSVVAGAILATIEQAG